jgi:hypothetical protein
VGGRAPAAGTGRKRLFLSVPGKPLWRFLYTYLWRRGFLDGYPGFVISVYMAIYEFEISMKIYELRQRARTAQALGASMREQPTRPLGG